MKNEPSNNNQDEVQGYTAQAAMSTFSIQFENHHNILPTFANVAQVSTSVNVTYQRINPLVGHELKA